MVAPVYPLGSPGAPIELYNGPIAVDSDDSLPGRIYADLAGDLQVRWELIEPDKTFPPADVELSLEMPDMGLTTIPARLNRGRGAGEIPDATLGSASAMCDRVIMHFTNLPAIFAAGRRWNTSAREWQLTLQERPDRSDVVSQFENELFFVVTHVGELRRTDGREFEANAAAKVIEAWQVALSFALGRYVAPVAPVGFDANGWRVWEQWASWRCDPMFGYLQWWENGPSDDLAVFVKLFVEAWLDPDRYDVTWHLARHLIASHHRGTTIEAKIMLVHAALEYLSWVTYVLGPLRRTQSSHDRTDRWTGAAAATWHLQELLCDANIDIAIPADLVAMTRRAQEMQPSAQANQVIDGPEVLTWLRGRLLHPKDAGEPYRINELVTEAWQLVTQYGELLLLHRLGYNGRYRPRTKTGGWVDSIPVPWSV
jgi:hypothetical protein